MKSKATKKLIEENKEYYDGSRAMSYNTAFIFVVGNRTAGKSFFWKWYATKRFIEKGEKFIYIRRYKNDLKKVAKNFFKDIAFKFPDHKLEYKNGEYYIDDKQAGIKLALNEGEQNKSNSLPEYNTLIFDEFLNKKERYIGGRNGIAEVEECLDLYLTVARGNGKYFRDDVRFVFISNALSIINPYFLYWGIDRRIQKGTKFVKQEGDAHGWVLELYVNTQARDELKESKIGDLVRGTQYEKYAFENEFLMDDEEFIGKAPAGCRYQCTMKYAGKKFGLWKDRENSIFYVNEKVDPSCPIIYSLDIDSHTTQTVLTNRSSQFYKALNASFKAGQIRFCDQLAKNAILIYLKM